MSPRETFGQTLKRVRLSKGMNQRDVARKINMDFSYYSRLECDKMGTPTRDTIVKITDAMECSEEEKVEILAAAGRVREEMEEQPLLKSLYRAATQLPESDLAELVRQAEQRLQEREAREE